VTLKVTVAGTGPFTYQWQLNGVNLPNYVVSTLPTLNLDDVSVADAGAYQVIISSPYGSVTSAVAIVTVALPPLNATLDTSRAVRLNFSGTPGSGYVLQMAPNLNAPVNWQSVFTNVADSTGHWSFSDTNSLNYPTRFYRLAPLSNCVPPPSGLVAWWRGEGNAVDSVSGNDGTLEGGVTYANGEVGRGFLFDGASGFISTLLLITNPQTFSLSLWFRTGITQGGVLMSFDSSQTALAGSLYDRNIYMDNTGALHFGFWNGEATQINSTAGYNDNNWHFAVGSLSPSTGLSFYLDGVLVGNNPAATTAQVYNGWWRIGEGNLNNWPFQPSSHYFQPRAVSRRSPGHLHRRKRGDVPLARLKI
jgi:hypothetical protein